MAMRARLWALAACVASSGAFRGPGAARPVSMMAAPVRVKDTVNRLKGSLQAGLKAQCSRMHVQLPRAPLGIEPQEKGAPVDPATPDREAARAMLEMFSALSDTSACVFNTALEAATAQSVWSVGEAGGLRIGSVVGLDVASGSRAARRKAKKKTDKKKKAFKSLQMLEDDGGKDPLDNVPADTEVLVVVSPSAATLESVKTLDKRFGLGTVIILLNPDLDGKGTQAATEMEGIFETVFYLQEAEQNLVFHEYGKPWELWSSEGLMGKPTLLHSQESRFFPGQVPEMEAAGLLDGKKESGGLFGNLFG